LIIKLRSGAAKVAAIEHARHFAAAWHPGIKQQFHYASWLYADAFHDLWNCCLLPIASGLSS
jgi:hypothetical protein